MRHPTLFLTSRGERHQQNALTAAPSELDITMRRDPSREEILRWLPLTEFLISERAGVIDAEMIAVGRNLKLIQRLGAQTWDMDLDAAQRANIPVCYLPVRTCAMVAEHMLLQMLATAKRARELMQIIADAADWGAPQRCTEDYFAYNWSRREHSRGVSGATVGILGFGEIGIELARRLRAFDCQVLYVKRNRLPEHAERALEIQFANQDELVRGSDFVCSLLPLFPETEQSLDAQFFAAMKPGAIFVHCGAGGVVDENALIAALRSGKLAGAALDTYTYEPMRADDPLLALARDPMRNLILTPHVAAGSGDASSKGRAGDYANIIAVLENKPLKYRLV
ncbi:glyoxylate reductase [Anaerolineae bacterium]|nr:glyoxylate reductase [Anaerolineae bacterium]